MVLKLAGLVKRGDVWIYRKVVPPQLRSIIGAREIWRSLGTGDLDQAQERWREVRAEVGRSLHEGRRVPAATEFSIKSSASPQAQEPPSHEAEQPESGGDNPAVSILFTRYYAERKLPAKTRMEWDLVLGRIQKILGGDKPVRSITQVHVRQLKDTLLAQPAKRGGGTLSPATVKKNLSGLRAVLSWAKRNGYLSGNPAEDFVVVTNKSDDEGRLPYSADDLKTIFKVDRTERAVAADHWLPLLALYTGARLEELGQLHVADVRRENGVDFLAIEPGQGKRVKTKSSKRRVPIHPRLAAHGFMGFVAQRKAAGAAFLFDLSVTSYGSRTAAWSKWWGRHAREACGISDPRKTFHSFRHGWKDAARAVMPEEHHDAITGHSNGSVGRSYGTGVPLNVLAQSMARVRLIGV